MGQTGAVETSQTGLVPSPAFAFSLQVPGVVILEGESRRFVFRDALVYEIFGLLDGRRTESQIVSSLGHLATAAEVIYCLRLLIKKGCIEHSPLGILPDNSPESIFWRLADRPRAAVAPCSVEIASFGVPGAAEFASELRRSGVAVSQDGGLRVVLVGDYLLPELAEINHAAVSNGRSWLVVKPIGVTVWLGPLFVPGQTACWQCLEPRLRGSAIYRTSDADDRLVAPRALTSSSISVAASLVATELAGLLLAGRSSVLMGAIVGFNLSRLETSRDEVTKKAHCRVCGDGKAVLGSTAILAAGDQRGYQTTRDASRTGLSARFARHVGSICGAVRMIERVDIPEVPEAHVYAAAINHLQRVDCASLASRDYLVAAAGKGFTADQARESALFEALERFSAVYEEPQPTTKATARSLGREAIWPNALYSFSENQYAARRAWNELYGRFQPIPEPFSPDEELHWTKVTALTDSAIKYVPTAYVYFHVPPGRGTRSCIADSNGIAAGPDFDSACLRALFELMERDAGGIWWYNRVSAPSLVLDTVPSDAFQRLRRRLRGLERELRAFPMPTDHGLPVVAVASWNTGRFAEQLALGFGSHPDPNAALESALAEHNQKLPVLLSAGGFAEDGLHVLWREIARHGAEALRFLDPTEQVSMAQAFPDACDLDQASLRQWGEQLAKSNLEVYVADLSKAELGLRVARVLSPGMRTFWRRTGPGRLFDLPATHAWTSRRLSEKELNPVTLVL